jgi:hypothetical protein
VTARMREIRQKGRPQVRCTDECEEDLKIMGMGNWRTEFTHRKEWRGSLLEAKIYDGL